MRAHERGGTLLFVPTTSQGRWAESIATPIPFEGTSAHARPVATLFWGTRHGAAAQFVYDQHDCVALVCSQDGEVNFFAWDEQSSEVLVLRHLDALYNKPFK